MEQPARRRPQVLGRLRRGRRTESHLVRACADKRTAPPSSSATRAKKAEGRVQAIVVDGVAVEAAESSGAGQTVASVALVLNQTPFYGESGGQMGDSGGAFSAESGARSCAVDGHRQKHLGDLHMPTSAR